MYVGTDYATTFHVFKKYDGRTDLSNNMLFAKAEVTRKSVPTCTETVQKWQSGSSYPRSLVPAYNEVVLDDYVSKIMCCWFASPYCVGTNIWSNDQIVQLLLKYLNMFSAISFKEYNLTAEQINWGVCFLFERINKFAKLNVIWNACLSFRLL